MSKAEDRYLEHFQDGRLRNCSSKEAFLLGYHQAEKDLELTWKDVALIETISKEFIKNNTTPMTDQDYYQEILKQFNGKRKK